MAFGVNLWLGRVEAHIAVADVKEGEANSSKTENEGSDAGVCDC